jgi:hypothetical protein
MRSLLLVALCASCFSVEMGKPMSPKGQAEITGPPSASMSAVQTTPDDLSNLVACARMALPSLTTDQIVAVAAAIRHAEADIASMRKTASSLPPAPVVEAKKP